jgi:hypothetical protein
MTAEAPNNDPVLPNFTGGSAWWRQRANPDEVSSHSLEMFDENLMLSSSCPKGMRLKNSSPARLSHGQPARCLVIRRMLPDTGCSRGRT